MGCLNLNEKILHNHLFSKLVSELKNIEPELAVIFGSYLLEPKIARDLDILIISKKFKDLYYQNRNLLLPKKHEEKRVDGYCFTPEEFKLIFNNQHPLIKAIINNHFSIIGEFDEYF